MHLVPIPTTHESLREWMPHWLPFLEHISRRSKEPIECLFDLVINFAVHIGLVWDGTRAHALVGVQFKYCGADLVGEVCWLTGKNRKAWQDLLPELERYLKQHCGCAVIRPICRPGWSRVISKRGYRITHYVMEKSL
jgi:hypothetical protein